MGVATKNAERIKNVLIADKKYNPQKVIKVVRADLFELFKNYFVFEDDGLFLKIDADAYGNYLVKVLLRAANMKALNCLL